MSRLNDIKKKLSSPYGAAAVTASDVYWLTVQVEELQKFKEAALQLQQADSLFSYTTNGVSTQPKGVTE